MATLSEYGFDPELEAPAALSASVQVTNEHEPSFARIQLSEPRRGFSFESSMVRTGETSECEVAAETAAALRNRKRPRANPLVRKHIGECLKCRGLYPNLVDAFERFDELAPIQWFVLLSHFRATMELGDEQLWSSLRGIGPVKSRSDRLAVKRPSRLNLRRLPVMRRSGP
jgi:hypothetical protein